MYLFGMSFYIISCRNTGDIRCLHLILLSLFKMSQCHSCTNTHSHQNRKDHFLRFSRHIPKNMASEAISCILCNEEFYCGKSYNFQNITLLTIFISDFTLFNCLWDALVKWNCHFTFQIHTHQKSGKTLLKRS